MHISSKLRMKWFVDNYAKKHSMSSSAIKVLDVGSYDVNGSYKEFFDSDKFEYVGLDMAEGPNVDIALENPYDWKEIDTGSYDIVISGQAFEHIEFFWLTMAEMARVLKKDGLMCIIAPNGFEEHRYPVDCYRFFTDGMIALARYVNLEPVHAHTNSAPPKDSEGWYSENRADAFLIAKKPYEGPTRLVDVTSYKCIPAEHDKLLNGLVPYSSKKGLWKWLATKFSKMV